MVVQERGSRAPTKTTMLKWEGEQGRKDFTETESEESECVNREKNMFIRTLKFLTLN